MSTMPTMAASTGRSVIPSAIRAELPLTTSTPLAGAGVDGVDGHEGGAARRPVRLHRLHEQQLAAG